jgi:uncharacterized integral membrane protein
MLVTDSEPAATNEPVTSEVGPSVAGDQPPATTGTVQRRARRAKRRNAGERHTRISGAWAAVAAITVLGVGLVDFIVENTRSVEIHFFSVSGRLSVAAALLAAALAGAAVVLAVGVARTAQLRLSIRHHRQVHEAASAAATDSENAQSNPPAS